MPVVEGDNEALVVETLPDLRGVGNDESSPGSVRILMGVVGMIPGQERT